MDLSNLIDAATHEFKQKIIACGDKWDQERCTFGFTYLCGHVVVGWPAQFILLPKGVPATRLEVGSQL